MNEEDNLFEPNKDDVVNVVNAINSLLAEKPYADMRVLDVLIGLEALAGSIRETLGIVGLTALEEDDE